MKNISSQKIWFFFFITIQILLIIGQISKQIISVKLNYKTQHYEKRLQQLTEEKKKLLYQLEALQNKQSIKKYAQETLGMHPIRLANVKKIGTYA